MTRVATLVSFALLPLLAQDKPAAPAASPEAVIIPVKTLSGDAFNRLARMLDIFGVPYKADDQLRTIVAYGPKDKVAQMRAVVEQLDRPGSEAAIGRNVDMTLTFLLCSTKPAAADRAAPADIEPVVRQLRAATPYKDITVLDSVPVRIQEGRESQQSGHLPGLPLKVPGQPPSFNSIIRTEAVIHKDSGRFVRFSRIDLSFSFPYPTGGQGQWQVARLGVVTAGDFKEGQKTVLGKISGIDDDSALFVVIALKILD